MQYSEFVILNSEAKYAMWIHIYEFKKIITQISVMNSFMNWVFMNSCAATFARTMSLINLEINKFKSWASYVGQWNVSLLQGSDPCFLITLVLHIFAEPLFSLIVVKMSNFRVPWVGLLCTGALPPLLNVLIAWMLLQAPCTFKGSAGGARSAALR